MQEKTVIIFINALLANKRNFITQKNDRKEKNSEKEKKDRKKSLTFFWKRIVTK